MTSRIHEEQVYEMQVGKADVLVQAYRDEGLPILRRVLGQDALVQIWEFESEAERRERRDALWADATWLDFAARFGPLILRRSMRILTPIDT